MMASMSFFTINDAFLKLTGGIIPLPQLLGLRGAMASVLILGLALLLGGLRLRLSARDWRLIGFRSLTEVGAAFFFLTALFNMPIANVTAVLQVLPLAVTLGAWLFFGEPVGWRRLSAIGVGFFGVLVIVQPGMQGFSVWSIYVLIAVVCVTGRDLVTRMMPAHIPSLTVTLSTSVVVGLAFGVLSLRAPWVPMDGLTWSYLIGSTLFIVGAYSLSVQVMRVGEVSFVAPFRYTSLLWALLLGFLVFGEWPDALTLLGAGIVVGAGIFTLRREGQRREAKEDVFD